MFDIRMSVTTSLIFTIIFMVLTLDSASANCCFERLFTETGRYRSLSSQIHRSKNKINTLSPRVTAITEQIVKLDHEIQILNNSADNLVKRKRAQAKANEVFPEIIQTLQTSSVFCDRGGSGQLVVSRPIATLIRRIRTHSSTLASHLEDTIILECHRQTAANELIEEFKVKGKKFIAALFTTSDKSQLDALYNLITERGHDKRQREGAAHGLRTELQREKGNQQSLQQEMRDARSAHRPFGHCGSVPPC